MQRNRLFLAAIALIVSMAQPAALRSQDNSPTETYAGDPLCRNVRGVYPHTLYKPDPDYDEKARKKKTQGVVILSVIVTKEGKTADIRVLKTLTTGLDYQAIKAVSRWRFEPVTQDGQPCPMRINVEVQFHLY